MKKIKIKTPAKINLTLKVEKKRPDGFHPIESVMAAVNLFDYIDIETKSMSACRYNKEPVINISSNSNEIPHDENNIAYKAAQLFFSTCSDISLKTEEANIYIEKNIPVCAGLAGGSTNASGVIYGLNKMFGMPLCKKEINMLLAKLGSDLNFCYEGGMKLCKGRGEIIEPFEFTTIPITIVKPKMLKISAREAYQKFDEMQYELNLPNNLEAALLPYYLELEYLHDLGFQMSGSGPSFFIQKPWLEDSLKEKLKENYLILENLKTIDCGVLEAD